MFCFTPYAIHGKISQQCLNGCPTNETNVKFGKSYILVILITYEGLLFDLTSKNALLAEYTRQLTP